MKRIRVGGLFDGETFRDDPVILTFEDGRITDIAWKTRGRVDWDYENAFAMPGLIDCHAHLTLPGDGRDYEVVALESDGYMAATAVLNAQRHLAAGVTTIRDNGSRRQTAFDARRVLDRDYRPAPRLLVSGPPITATGAHFWWCGGEADGKTSIVRRVRDIAKHGADHIKVMASGGGTRGTDPGRTTYTGEEIRAAVEAAHALGLPTTAHCRSTDSIQVATSSGIDCVEHAEFVNEGGEILFEPDTARFLIASAPWICPTLQASGEHERQWLARDRGPSWQQRRAAITAEMNARIRTVRELLRMGARERILFGTDAGPFFSPFGDVATELMLLHRAGLEPMECLQAATSRAACALGIDGIAGQLAEGLAADVLLVAESPIHDLQTIRTPIAVVRQGMMVGKTIGAASGNERS